MADPIEALKDHIEAIRREAYERGVEAGRGAAMREVADFARARFGKPSLFDDLPPLTTQWTAAGNGPKRTPRGQNRKLILDYLREAGTVDGVKELQRGIQLRTDIHVPYSSLQNAVGQLMRDGQVLVVDNLILLAKTNTTSPDHSEEAV